MNTVTFVTKQIKHIIMEREEVFVMYLISVYFDETTEKRINGYMKQIEKATGNTLMTQGNIPPHITVAAFQTESEDDAREIFLRKKEELESGKIQWVSVGSFLPGVIYITPVLNEYLHHLVETYYKEITGREGVKIDHRYMPFSWLPHSTLAKHLSKEQLTIAFEVMQKQFTPLEGKVTKIGLSKTKPYEDLEIIDLINKKIK